MSNILILSDPQLHSWERFGMSDQKGISNRFQQQIDILEQVCEIVRKKEVKALFIDGDLFQKVGGAPSEVLNITYKYLDKMGVPVIFVDGNHDLVERTNPEWYQRSNFFLKEIFAPVNYGVLVDYKRGLARVGDFRVKLVDYSTPDEEISSIKGYEMVLVHKTPKGAKVGKHTFKTGVNWRPLAKNNKLVFFGHIHEGQQMADNCWVIGSPMHLNFADKGNRGVYLVDTKTVKAEFVRLKYPEFLVVDSPDQVKKDDGNYYWVKNATKNVDADNVITTVVPEVYEERIKSDDFMGILKEWLQLNKKPEEYLTKIEPILVYKIRSAVKVFDGRLTFVGVKDFMSVKYADYEVNNGFTFIIGKNGAGKTSLFGDPVAWCLFGENTKKMRADEVIRSRPEKQKNCAVAINLKEKNGTSYDIIRTRKKGLDITRTVNGKSNKMFEDGMREEDKQHILESILGFDLTTFMASCYFPQENIKVLTEMGDTARNNMVTNFLGFETYDDLHGDVKEKIKEIEGLIEVLVARRDSISNKISGLKDRIDDSKEIIEEKKKKINEYKLKAEDCISKIEELKKQLKSLKKDQGPDTSVNYDKEIGMLKDKIGKLLSKKDGYKSKKEECDSLLTAAMEKKSEISSEMAVIKNNMDDKQEIIDGLSELVTGVVCDKCGSKITKKTKDAYVAKVKAEYDKLKSEYAVVESKYHEVCDLARNITLKWEGFKSKIQGIEDEFIEINSKIDDLGDRKEEQQKEQHSYDLKRLEIESRIKNVKVEANGCFESMEDAKKEASTTNSKIALMREDIDKLEQELGSIEVEELNLLNDKEIYEFWKHAFSSKGIRVRLLDRFCNEFNAIVNNYLSRASAGLMSIAMKPTATTGSGEERDKLSMEIIYKGIEVSYRSLSGGEKRRIDVSLCLTMNEWVSKRYGIENGLLGWIGLDEVFSNLDKPGEEAIATLLNELGSSRALFVISHTPELSSYADNIWAVEKVDDVSNLIKDGASYL